MEPRESEGFRLDEEPLRASVLKAYHEKRGTSLKAKRTLDAIRQFLSGPPGGEPAGGRYWFEESPAASIRSYIEDLDRAEPGLSGAVLDPLLSAVAQMESAGAAEIAPNVPMYISSLAGAIAVKRRIDETLATAALAAALIGLGRVGRTPFTEARRT
jgi:hypothetical protein